LKRRSGTREPPEPVFFTDRDLGKLFPKILREGGLRVEPYHEHFESPTVPDEERLAFVGGRGWVALSRDVRIRYTSVQLESLMAFRVRAFFVVGKAPHQELAECFVRASSRVAGLLRRAHGPFLAKVLCPSGEVRMWLTHAEWSRAREDRQRPVR
jgi:hypothetical protein